jgi:hypothetical protein
VFNKSVLVYYDIFNSGIFHRCFVKENQKKEFVMVARCHFLRGGNSLYVAGAAANKKVRGNVREEFENLWQGNWAQG